MLARAHPMQVQPRDRRCAARPGVFGNVPASPVLNKYRNAAQIRDTLLAVIGDSSVATMNSTGMITFGSDSEVGNAFSVAVEDSVAFTDEVFTTVARIELTSGAEGVTPTAAPGAATDVYSTGLVAAETLVGGTSHSGWLGNLTSERNVHDIAGVASTKFLHAAAMGLGAAISKVGAPADVTREEGATDEPQRSAWEILRELKGAVEGPEDWAAEADHYLYGTPKRGPSPDSD